ncbi:uncharacterized protein [Taeniopygia guttata]|uniref:uncharacterized protein n=1 Tax=Taeniopygia guttata TaxID=59729 RepID=UPI003BB86B28
MEKMGFTVAEPELMEHRFPNLPPAPQTQVRDKKTKRKLGGNAKSTSRQYFCPAAQLTPLKEVPKGQKHNSFFSLQLMDRKTFHSSHPNFLCGPKQPCLIQQMFSSSKSHGQLDKASSFSAGQQHS